MSEDAGAAASGAQDGAAPQGQDSGGNQTPETSQGGSGSHGPTPGIDDRSAESLLADAVNSDGDGKDGDDLAAQLAKLQKQNADLLKHNRTWEKRAKENAEKAKNFDAYQESQMTEQQKLAARAEAAERAAAEAQGRYHRTLAAATYDLPPSLIEHLGNGTEEEITSRAETFAAAINEKAAIPPPANAQANGRGQQAQPPAVNGNFGRPVESLRPGALPASDNKPRDPNQWVRDTFARKN